MKMVMKMVMVMVMKMVMVTVMVMVMAMVMVMVMTARSPLLPHKLSPRLEVAEKRLLNQRLERSLHSGGLPIQTLRHALYAKCSRPSFHAR
jgi:hypothetical protein